MLSNSTWCKAAGAGLLAALAVTSGAGLGAGPSGAGVRGLPDSGGSMNLRDDLLYAELMVHQGTPYAPFFDGRRVRVVLAIEDGAFEQVQAAITASGGSTQHVERDIGYLRAEIPFPKWPAVRRLAGVTAASIDGALAPRWRDEQPEPRAREDSRPDLPESALVPTGLPVAASSDITAVRTTQSHEALGLSRLWQVHPTFDGRGIGIAILEPLTGNADFTHPALRHAWDMTGQIVPKTADVLLPTSSPRRVKADVEFTAGETLAWLPVGLARLPHAGTFRWGASLLPSGTLPILWDATSGEVYIDVNRDLDYGNDAPLRDARTDPASSIAVPGAGRIRVTLPADRREVRLHLGDQQHAMMGSSAAAAAERDGIAGTAPGARLIFVEPADTSPVNPGFGSSPSALIEALLSAARHPAVDVISISMVSLVEQPSTATDVVSVLTRRIVDRYNKPIVKAAGNGLGLATADTLGDAALVVGAFFPRSSAHRYLGASGTRDAVPHYSSRGPLQDGTASPDVVGPIGEPVAAPCRPPSPADRRARLLTLPACYRLSGGTSAAAPAIAGLAASLLSGLKQQQRPVTADALYAALRATARMLPDAVATQGAGMPQADAAWAMLARDLPTLRVESRAPVAHSLQSYLPAERQGAGLYEREGWRAKQSGRRSMVIRRDSGPEVLQYELALMGDVETFSVPRRVVTHKGVDVVVPIDIDVKHAGVHSARLAFRDVSGSTQTLDRQLTIVAADELPRPGSRAANRTYTGALREFESRFVPIHVPADVDALRLALDANEEVRAVVQDPAGRTVSRDLVEPRDAANAGRVFLIPRPMPGTWIVSLNRGGREELMVTAGEHAYTLDISAVFHRLSQVGPGAFGSRPLQIELAGTADIDVASYRARTTTTTAEAIADTPVTLPFTVEEGTTLAQWRVEAAGSGRVHAYLSDCSSGTCARRDAGVPAAGVYMSTMERPAAGRWMLAVTTGPRSTSPQPFTVKFSVARTSADSAEPEVASRPTRLGTRKQVFDVACNETADTLSLLLQLMPRPVTPAKKAKTSQEESVTAAALPAVRLMPCEAKVTPTMAQEARRH